MILFMRVFPMLGICLLLACSKEANTIEPTLPGSVLAAIQRAGFSTEGIMVLDDGYLVEGDILLRDADLVDPLWSSLETMTEQYHTVNTVKVQGSRNIRISISMVFPVQFVNALDEAIRRFNAENLTLKFQRVASGGDIIVERGYGLYGATSGFPDRKGNPFPRIRINTSFLGKNPHPLFIATIIAHEMGHCIGFRHTDMKNRSFSCGGKSVNEGAGKGGAVWIPGTALGAEKGSWMLACIAADADRPFTQTDKLALAYLY